MGLLYIFGALVFYWLGFSSLRVFVCLVLVSDFPTWLPMTKAVGHTAAAFVILADFPIWAATTYKVTGTFNCRNSMPSHAKRVRKERSLLQVCPRCFTSILSHSGLLFGRSEGFLISFQVISIDIMIIYSLGILVWAVPCWDVWVYTYIYNHIYIYVKLHEFEWHVKPTYHWGPWAF